MCLLNRLVLSVKMWVYAVNQTFQRRLQGCKNGVFEMDISPDTLRHQSHVFIQDASIRPVARIDLGGGGTPKKWTFWTQKVDFIEPHPLTLLQKPHFWPTLWLTKSAFLADLGGVRRTPAPPSYGPGFNVVRLVFWSQSAVLCNGKTCESIVYVFHCRHIGLN